MCIFLLQNPLGHLLFRLHRCTGLDPGNYSGLSCICSSLEQPDWFAVYFCWKGVMQKCFMHHGPCPWIFRSDISHCLYQDRSNKLLSQFYTEKAKHNNIMYFVACSKTDSDWGLFYKAFSRLHNGSCLAIASDFLVLFVWSLILYYCN